MTILVNFGGPRSLDEIPFFLEELLTDRDLIHTRWPDWAHKFLFRRVARKRSRTVCHDYETIGGKSPIFFDTERIADLLTSENSPVLTFHRYLPATHAESLKKISDLVQTAKEIRVLPLFPQFSYT